MADETGQAKRGSVRFLVYDGSSDRSWEPFALTRPLGELTFGATTLRRRAEFVLGMTCEGYLVDAGGGRSHLARWPGLETTLVEDVLVDRDRPTLVLSAVAALEFGAGSSPCMHALLAGMEPSAFVVDGRRGGWVIPPGEDVAAGRAAQVACELPGATLRHPWSLVALNPPRLLADLEDRALFGRSWARTDSVGSGPSSCRVLGDEPVSIAPGVELEPGAIIDARKGSVRIGYGARVEAGARLVGPMALGPGARVRSGTRLVGPLAVGGGANLLGGEISVSSVGRGCRIRGELSHSVVGDFVNKAHEGHIGHSVVGDWVNLGAGTVNSNLKNTYTTVRVRSAAGDRETDMLKMGCLIGDWVRTGIGTLLGAGSAIGAGGNLFGGGLAPGFVPPFSWGEGPERYRADEFIGSLRRMMERRGQDLDPVFEAHVRRTWQVSRPGETP